MSTGRVEIPSAEKLGKMLYSLQFTALRWERLPQAVRDSYVKDAERLLGMMADDTFI